MRRVFCCYYWFVAWDQISLGINVSLTGPHVEVHLPFGFVRLGWLLTYPTPLAACYAHRRWGWELHPRTQALGEVPGLRAGTD